MDSVPSLLQESAANEISEWTRSQEAAKKARSEKIKRVKVIYEDEGQNFGTDPEDEATLVNRFTVATNLRKKRIEEVFRSIRRARDVQLCFAVDCTGSMASHINGVKESIYDIVKMLTDIPSGGSGKTAEAQSIKVAFVAYRDFPPESGTGHFEVLPFMPASDIAKFKDFVGRLSASGGGDAEDVFGGLETALNLPWSQDCGTNVIFHICDAPCHGREFHQPGYYDTHANGDPKGRTCQDIFSRMRQKGIQYHFGKIDERTDVMIRKFSEVYGEPIVAFDIKDVVNIRDAVFTAVSLSISASVSSSQQTVGVDRPVRTFTLHKARPDWSTIAEAKGMFVSYDFPDSIDDIVKDVPLGRRKPKQAIVKIAQNPFGKGAERLAFYGKDVTTYVDEKIGAKGGSSSKSQEADKKKVLKKDEEIVLKEYLHLGKGMNSSKRYELSNQMQTIASYLAQEFVKDLKDRTGMSKKIKFMKIRTLLLNGVPPRIMSCEKLFAATDKFVRFTNNTSYHIIEEKAVALGVSVEFVQLVIAFSHWTYKATNRFLMVVDLEGIVGKIASDGQTGVLLTDPAIHCDDVTRYGKMNHGPGGMEKFFESHKCNQFCEKLGIDRFLPL